MENLISTVEAAKLLSCAPITIRSMIKRGDLPQPIRVHAKCWRHRRADVEALALELAGAGAANDNAGEGKAND